MKIGISEGHTINTRGIKTSANGILNEYDVIREYVPHMIAYLEQYKDIELINVTPPIRIYDKARDEVFYRINKANKEKCDLYISCHVNDADDPKANGTGVFHHVNSVSGKLLANYIQKEIVSLGFRDRGDKTGKYWELTHTNMPAVIIEPFFVKNVSDCTRYDPKKLGEAIAKGIIKFLGYSEVEDMELIKLREQIKEQQIEINQLKNKLNSIKDIIGG